ncbi:hypothetical protein H6G00_18540 [Leptolyngbya sp. FACHB-541]|uniref:hypothetical protein n=1 Tax=Leptolyngbya sp. FACHB-541 TaxID=2692810 RepID=UPI001683B024|nr:hypothetical protein [Leptolyngbya sp. FACHB-541]MBD1998601.1 hypothetical protein [Leptolyngbya sp. FACHB-541]
MSSFCWLLLQSQPINPIYSTAPPIWAQLFTVLVIGLLTAFAFQLLLTVLGIALGISVLKVGSSESAHEDDRSSNSSTIGLLAGFGVFLTVNTVLFAACFLATKFGQISDPIAGAIAGIVIWSAYFLLMLWLSSTAVSSLVGVILDALTGGFRRIVAAIANALAGNKAEPITEEQMLSSIREEMQAALDTVNLRQMIEEQLQTIPLPSVQAGSSSHLSRSISAANDAEPSSLNLTTTELWQQITTYLQDASSKSLTPKRVERKLQKMLQAGTANGLAGNPALDLDALAQVLDQREDLSDNRKQRILDQLEQTWQQFLQESSIAEMTEPEIADSESDAIAAPSSEERSPTTTKLLQSALDTTVDQVLTHLPKLLQQSDLSLPKEVGLAPMILSIALAKVKDSVDGNAVVDTVVDNLPSLNVPSSKDNDSNDTNFKQALEGLLASSISLPNLNQSLITQATQLREKAMQPIDSIQRSAQERIDTVKRQTQQQFEMTRKAAATAAWWLFLTASTGAASAAFAGAWAAGFNPVEFFSSYVSSSAAILNGL